MDEQLAIDEVEYWMALESLLARFAQDLDRVMATLENLSEKEAHEYLFRARFNVAAACAAVAGKVGNTPASAGVRAYQ